MLFSSNLFLFLFLPAVLGVYYLLDRQFRNPFLLLVSLVFYAWGTGKFVVMMVVSALLNYVSALVLEHLHTPVWRKLCLAVTVVLAKMVGCMLPLAAKAVKLDPAVMASPFISTIVDALSLLVYFMFAKMLLNI